MKQNKHTLTVLPLSYNFCRNNTNIYITLIKKDNKITKVFNNNDIYYICFYKTTLTEINKNIKEENIKTLTALEDSLDIYILYTIMKQQQNIPSKNFFLKYNNNKLSKNIIYLPYYDGYTNDLPLIKFFNYSNYKNVI